MAEHYPGPWIDSPEVSDAIIAPNMGDDPNGIKYYGGTLVAETVAPCNKPLIKCAPSMLALLEKALPIIEEEAERRDQACISDVPSVQPYWSEMRDLTNEISAEIDQAYGREAAKPDSELCPHGFGFVEYCPDCKPLPDEDSGDYDYAADDQNFDAAREKGRI